LQLVIHVARPPSLSPRRRLVPRCRSPSLVACRRVPVPLPPPRCFHHRRLVASSPRCCRHVIARPRCCSTRYHSPATPTTSLGPETAAVCCRRLVHHVAKSGGARAVLRSWGCAGIRASRGSSSPPRFPGFLSTASIPPLTALSFPINSRIYIVIPSSFSRVRDPDPVFPTPLPPCLITSPFQSISLPKAKLQCPSVFLR
jgi:hypothetical protein